MIKSMNENQIEAAKYLLSLCAAVLNDEELKKPSKDIDLPYLFSLAKAHSILNVLYYAVKKSDIQNEKMKASLDTFHQKQLLMTSNQQYETQKLQMLFEENNIDNILLKGHYIKEAYPSADMRSMTDIDIVYKPCDEQKIIACLKENGYEFKVKSDKSQNFVKPPYMYIELHTDISGFANCSDYFKDIWKKSVLVDGFNHSYKMCDEQLYIHHVVHCARHFCDGGIGIRMIMDFYVLRKKLALNNEYIKNELQKLSLSKFEKHMIMLSENWFSSCENEIEFDEASMFIILSSTFGRSEVSILNTASEHNKTQKGGKFGYLLRRVFVPAKKLSNVYVNAEKNKILYPVYLLRYWCRRIFIRRDLYASHLKNHIYTSNEEYEYIFKVLESVGIERGGESEKIQ